MGPATFAAWPMMFSTSGAPCTGLVSIGALITTSFANSLPKSSLLASVSMATRNGCFAIACPRLLPGALPVAGSSGVRCRGDRQCDVGRHAPPIPRPDPFQDHEERLRHCNLAGIGDRDVYRHIGLDHVAGQRDDLLFVVVR